MGIVAKVASTFRDVWFKSAGNGQVQQGRLLPNIHEKIIQTVQFHQKKTEKATETGDRARGSAHYQKGLLLLFSLNCMFIIIKTRS